MDKNMMNAGLGQDSKVDDTTFSLYGKTFVVNKQRSAFVSLKQLVIACAESVRKQFTHMYQNEVENNFKFDDNYTPDGFVMNINRMAVKCMNEGVFSILEWIMSNDILPLSLLEDDIFDTYFFPNMNAEDVFESIFADWMKDFDKFVRGANTSNFLGRLTGAAGMGAYHLRLKRILNDPVTLKAMTDVMYSDMLSILDSLREVQKDLGVKNISFVTEKKAKRAKQLFSSLQDSSFPDDEKLDICIQILEQNPYYEPCYLYLINNFGDSDKEIQRIADYFNVKLSNQPVAKPEVSANAPMISSPSISSKIEMIETILAEVDDEIQGAYVFIGEDIPPKKLENAEKTYIGKLSESEYILLLVDSTLFGSAKEGCTLTSKRLYYKQAFSTPGYVNISEIESVASKKDDIIITTKNAIVHEISLLFETSELTEIIQDIVNILND